MSEQPRVTEIGSLIRKISSFQEAANDVSSDEAARAEVLLASSKLARMLEKPSDIPYKASFSVGELVKKVSKSERGVDGVRQAIPLMCVRVAIDLHLFESIVKCTQLDGEATAAMLAKTSGAETLFIVRLMRVLVAEGYASEKDVDTYGSTSLTVEMTKPSAQATIIFKFDQMMIPLAKMPEYLKSIGYRCPTDSNNGLIQYAIGTDKPTWEYFASQPGVMETFNTFMSGVRGARISWVDWFPIEERLLNGANMEQDSVLMVDIGGGRGHNLEEVKAKFPKAPGRFLLQDLPLVIKDVGKLDDRVEPMSIDMFDTQPIKDARIYYFHFIFHDWSDESSRLILRKTAAAMKKGYSKLIIGDHILPDKDAPLIAACTDLTMMIFHSAMERCRRQWQDLLDSAGLEIVGVWPPPGVGDGIIEAMLKT